MNIQEARKRLPELAGLSDESALNVIHEVYYPAMDKAELGSRLGIKPIAAPAPERSTLRVMGDAGITALKGAIGVPEAAVGVADIFTGGRVGKFLENDGGDFGFRPKEAKAILDQGYSEQQKQAFRNVADAKGVVDTAVAAIQNPSVIAHAVGESIPMMGMGGLIGRGVMAAAPKVGALGAGALGEGAVAAGAAAEQIRQQTADGLLTGKQSAMAGATGLTTTVFGVLGGKIAQRLGIADVDTMLAAAGTNPAVRKGVVRSMLEGAATEGLLEELPQSVSEQVLQNIALNKPLDEGVDQAIVLGTLAGSTMGGGANALNSFAQPSQASVIRASEKVPESGPLSRAANAGVEARAQAVEATGVDPTQPPQEQTQQPEPVDDPVVDRIKALPADKRTEALRAYAVLNREGLAKGVVQYNRKLLDRLLAENDGNDKADPATESSGPLLLGYDQTPTGVMLAGPDGIRPEGRADVVNREQELGRQRDLGLTPDVLRAPRSQATPEQSPQMAAPEVVEPPDTNVVDAQEPAPPTSTPQSMGAFSTPQEAEAYISAQRRSGGSRFQALPLPMEGGSFGVATAESPEFGRAQAFRVKQERQAAGILEGDTLNKLGQPFKTKASAVLATKKIGGDAVPVKGGFVVRKAAAPVVDSMAAPAVDAEPEPVAALTQATHKDPGEPAEPVSPLLVAESIKKAANNEARKPSDMKAELLGRIDQALGSAHTLKYHKDYNSSGFDRSAWLKKNAPYVEFDVPGDGKFKVLNTKEGLEEFRQKVKSSRGFSDSGQRGGPPNFNSSAASNGVAGAIENMIGEGDFQAAKDYAKAKGVDIGSLKLTLSATKALIEHEKNKPTDADVTNTETQPAAQAEATSDQAPAAGAVSPTAEPPDVPGAGSSPLEAAGVAGKPIDDEWTAFAPQSGTKSVPRAEMPQIKAEHRGAMVNFLNARGIAHESEVEIASVDLKPTQAEFSPKKVARAKEFTGGDRSILVSSDGYVVDGHHQWLAKLETGQAVKATRLDAPIEKLLAEVREFPSAETGAGATPAKAEPPFSQEPNERDAFTLERLNRDTNKMEPVTFKRGEYITYKIGDKAQFGDIDGISPTRREFSVGGLWYPMGFAYKAERPVAAEKKTVPLSSVIARANKEYGEGLTEADRVPAPKPASKTPTVDRTMAVMEAVRSGTGSIADYKSSFAALESGEAAVKAELNAKTKEELLKAGGPYFYMRFKNDNKPDIIKAFYNDLLNEYALGKSYGSNAWVMSSGGFAAHERRQHEALKALVEAQTDDDLKAFAAEVAARRAEVKAKGDAKRAAMANPQSLGDFRAVMREHITGGKTRKEAFLMLTPEQRLRYDELEAESTRQEREARKRAIKTEVKSAGQTTGGEIVATKHTRDGYDLFVVKLADRLSREDYTTVLASAKKLGGWYSAFRGGGAIPGFQFKDKANAEAFLKLAGGDTADAQAQAEQRRDAFEDDRSETAAERLRTMADKLEQQADEIEGADRKTNTARRARFASSALAGAAEMKAKAKTMRNVAKAIDDGNAKFLDGIRTKSQVDMLTGFVATAKYNELAAKYSTYAEQEKRKGEPPTVETADFAEFPAFTAYRSDLASLARQMLEVEGTKKLGQQLMNVADDVTDAYIEFAKEPGNLAKLSTFSIRRGDEVKAAIFPSKDLAERAIKRSGLTGKAIVLAEKRGVNRIIMSPSEAINAKVWTGDGDKRVTLTADAGNTLVEAIGRRGNKSNGLAVPWQFQTAHDRLKALARTGIETPAEFRSALREFIGMQEQAVSNKVRELELAMVGRKSDGLDFFPTPAEVADQMVEAADLTPDMAVLEPSGGMGHIADRIRAAGAEPDVIEMAEDRRELLEQKGYNLTGRDFLDLKPREFFTYGDIFRAPDGQEGILRGLGGMGSDRVRLVREDGTVIGYYDYDQLEGVRHSGSGSGYDRIIMNPPFSNRRDAEHVQHAYSLLKPGGRIVAIMGEGVFFGSDKRAKDFRDWLDEVGGTSEKLPAGSFMDPSLPVNTGVSARMVVIDRPLSDSQEPGNTKTKFSRQKTSADEQALEYISQQSDVFSLPKSKAKDLESIIAENMPGLTFKKSKFGDLTTYKFTLPDGTPADMSVRPPNPYGPVLYGWDKGPDGEMTNIITERPGENAEAMDGKTDVWIDVSRLKSGELGQAIYNIAATYAHNNDMVFIGDPNGLSDIALRRRTENMLNSALKFGTTEHLGPHPMQADGSKAQGVPPLRWVYGDHVGNIERMIDVSRRSADNAGYVGAADYIPAAETGSPEGRGRFVDGMGQTVGREDFDSTAGLPGNRAAQAGGRTLARMAVFESLLQRAGESRAETWGGRGRGGILAELGKIVREFAVAQKDDRIFYSRGDSRSGLTTDAAQSAVDSITSKWANAPEIVVVQDMLDSRVPEQARQDNASQQSQNAQGDPEGFYLGGKVYVVAGALKSEADVARVVFHEVLGHAGLRGVFGDKLNPILNQIAALRKAEIQAKARQYGIDIMTKEGRLEAAEEVLAEMAQTLPELGFVRRAVAAIRSWLRTNVPGFAKLKLTDAEIVRDYLIPARGFVERGGAAAGEVPTVAGGGTATRYSRSLSTAFADGLNNVRDLNLPAGYKVNDLFQSKGKLHWWHKTVGTQYNLAQRSPEFKPVFDTAQNFINDVAFYASTAADEAPTILPKLEDLKDIAKNPLSAADNKAIAAPIFEGTLVWTRDADGKPVKADPASDAPVGTVFTPDELRSLFNLTDEQVSLYQEFRAAVDMSLASMAAADMVRFGGKDLEAVRDQMLSADSLDDATQVAAMHLETLAAADAGRAAVLRDTAERLQQKADAAKDLMARGYAPLSRYGQHSLDVVDASGERVYFGLFESRAEANKMARQMRDNFPEATVSQGTMSQEEYKLFSGVSPETVELFGDMLGLEATGDGEADQAFQQYLKLAKANRSAMKRLIHRKGIAGFSEDPGRVLAGFVYSNARQTSSSLHMGQLTEAVAAVPKGQGELKDAAIKLRDYVQNPQEEAQAFRGLLFAQYLGGSIASAIVNTTQPFTVTFPWLSQYGGIAKAAGQMRRATADALKTSTGDADLDAALKDAEESGIVSPQEVFQLQAQAAGRAPLRAGDGTVAGNAMATASNALSKFSLAWGKLFGVAEQFNRRTTFIAAYRTAVEQGMADPAAFAEKAIYETQFTYSKANKPRWARGAIGGTLFTFKQYSVNYMELLHRMATQGGPEGKRAALLALGVLFLLSGAGGLPFAEDIDDLIDGAMQRMGYNFSSKQAKQEFFTNIFGQAGAQFVMRGVSGLAGVPIDISGRMGMQNLVPGTGILLKKEDRTRDLMEFAGPAGDFVKRIAESGEKLMAGDVLGPRGAVVTVLPLAMRNVAKAHEMATTGMYLDTKGKKVLDADGFDAMAKAVGFQPNDVARVLDATFEVQRRIGLNRMRESEIANKWAKGIFLGDQALVQEARADIKAWNEQNPDAPIRIQMPQITRRVREMRTSKQDRIAKTAPQEIRDQVRRELSKELGQ